MSSYLLYRDDICPPLSLATISQILSQGGHWKLSTREHNHDLDCGDIWQVKSLLHTYD